MLLEKARKTIDRYHLLDRAERVVVGVSGGVDSMVLLRLLNVIREDFGLSLIVAHVNHGLRPDESEREAELVEKESSRLGLPFEYGRFDARGFSRSAGLSLQDAARRIRYHFFKTLLLKYQAHKIALGHHADDQVETILLRLLRGSGLRGLRGMLPIRQRRVIRPLLETWRSEIESYAAENEILYLTDSSNLKKDYLRNRLRLDLIPFIEREYQSNFKDSVTRTAAILREEDDYLEREAGKASQTMIHEEKGSLTFKYSEFQSYPPSIQWRIVEKLLDRIYQEETLGDEAWFSIHPLYEKLKHPAPSFLLELPHGIQIAKRYDQVMLKICETRLVPPFEVELSLPGPTRIEEIEREVKIEVEEIQNKLKREGLVSSPNVALLDYQQLQFPLKMRNFRPGDRFQPLGVQGEQKLKKFFIDHKVPRYERPGISLLLSGERIVWVVGYRIDDRVKVTEKTKKVLRIEVM
jgi:tRNA(Ile)-lysidine synthase